MQVTLPYVLTGTIRGTKGPDRIGLGVEVKTYKRSNDLSSVASRPVGQPSATAFMIGGERDTAHDWLGGTLQWGFKALMATIWYLERR